MPRIRLRYLSGSRAGQVEVFPIPRMGSLKLGRDASCDVRFHPSDDRGISRHHALIDWSADDPPLVRLSDLLSSNGTFLNGRRIGRSVLLRAGDRLQLSPSGPQIEFDLDTGELESSEQERPHGLADQTQEMPAVAFSTVRIAR